MKVVFRSTASDDVDRIYAWISKDSPAAADSVIIRILDSAEYLGWFPYMGNDGRARGTHEWIVKGLPFIVVYEVHETAEEVVVIAVFHCAQNR